MEEAGRVSKLNLKISSESIHEREQRAMAAEIEKSKEPTAAFGKKKRKIKRPEEDDEVAI